MKKRMLLIFVISLFVVCFAGCGEVKDVKSEDEFSEESVESEESEEENIKSNSKKDKREKKENNKDQNETGLDNLSTALKEKKSQEESLSESDDVEYDLVEVCNFDTDKPQSDLLPEDIDVDTLNWLSAACAIQMLRNGLDTDVISGYPDDEFGIMMSEMMLEEGWSIEDRKTLLEKNEWLLTEGHRKGYIEKVDRLKKDGILSYPYKKPEDYMDIIYEKYKDDLDETEQARMYTSALLYIAYGEHAIDGWDYTRAINVLAMGYRAGYISLEEYMEQSLLIADKIKKTYSDWEELGRSYMKGYVYWRPTGDASEEYDLRWEILEELLEEQEEGIGPYSLDFDYKLIFKS